MELETLLAINQRQSEKLTNQVSCLNLINNAVVTWNTLYMETAIKQPSIKES
jgi:TnpA family transposase